MIKTYYLLKHHRNSKFKNYSNEELALAYQQTRDNALIAEMYCRNLGYWTLQASRIRIIDSTEKASIVLRNIGKGMLNYTADKGCNVLTFINSGVRNDFGGYRTKHKYKDRHMENIMLNIDEECDDDGNTLLDLIPEEDNNEFATAILKLTINTDNTLTNKEKVLCNLIIDNPRIQINEISEEMHITTQYVWIMKKNLAKKLKVSLCFED